MKNLRQFCAAIVITLALTFSAFAGDINAPGISTQPPPPPQPSATGKIGRSGVVCTSDMTCSGAVALDPLTEITLTMLESMLSYF
jgi:hypothetical protein